MDLKERIHELVDEVPPERLEEVERMLRGVVPSRASLSPQERWQRMLPLIQKREGGQALTEDERRELISLGRGMSAHLPGSVDDFLREKHEETEREEAHWAANYRRRAA